MVPPLVQRMAGELIATASTEGSWQSQPLGFFLDGGGILSLDKSAFFFGAELDSPSDVARALPFFG